tara:strand:+ start:1377 stop:3065 length:1689 start_codon:yes stop_codon:yes gene_type:complete
MFLGVSAFYHESSVALVSKNGDLIDFQKEEWHSRVKGDKSFPKLSIEKIIKDNQDDYPNITEIIFYERPLRAWLTVIKDTIKNHGYLNDLSKNYFRNFFNGSMSFYKEISKFKELKKCKIKYFDHHLSHTYSALMYSESFFPKISVVIDGIGDNKTISIYKINSLTDINLIWSLDYPYSVGLFYSAITDFLGYGVNNGEFKVMALSSYGKPVFKDEFYKIMNFKDGKFNFDTSFFSYQYSTNKSYSEKLLNLIGEPRMSLNNLDMTDPNFSKYADIASSAQKILEEIVIKIFDYAYKKTKINNFIFSGGVALNSTLVSKISDLSYINSLEIPPSPGDSGASIGAAFYLSCDPKITKPISVNLYTGKVKYSKYFIEQKLNKLYDDKNIIKGAAELINDQKIICTCLGNIETGPRALGNRSFLCDARNEELVKKLNSDIKRRSDFIPTAPVMSIETSKKYFLINKINEKLAETMSTIVMANDNALLRYKSILHFDFTARIQIAKKNTFISNLLSSENANFEILANTSFNISSDPMVYSLEDAIMTMKRTGLKYLITDFGIFEIR